MFLPVSADEKAATERKNAERKRAYIQVEEWAMEAIPASIRSGVIISVQEVECGDPDCAPIDTAVAIIFPSGGRGMMGLPCTAVEVAQDDLLEGFPTQEVLIKWYRGEEAEWPPFDEDEDEDEDMIPTLRFDVGTRVECRVKPDPVTGWEKGTIIQQWYREQGWPPNAWASYKVDLDNGTRIFAPADIDQVVRRINE